jgi:hypothetical protein
VPGSAGKTIPAMPITTSATPATHRSTAIRIASPTGAR